MFSLERQQAKLTSVNTRPEFHGEDNLTAMDLKIEIKVSNDVLAEFHPTLKSMLFKKEEGPQPELIEDSNHLTGLRFIDLGPLKWKKEYEGYETTVHYGTGNGSDICLEMCKVDRFVISPMEGGSVGISFRVQVHPTKESEIGRLVTLAQREIEVSLVPPEAETPGELFQ